MQKKTIIIAKCFDTSTSGPANIVRGLINEFDKEHLPYLAVLLKEGSSKGTFLREVVETLKKEHKAVVNVHTEGFLIPLVVYLCSLVFKSHSYYLTVHGIYRIEAEMENSYSRRYGNIEKYLYKHFQNLICVSQMLKDDIKNIYGRVQNVYVIPNATDAYSEECFVEGAVKEIISLGGLRRCKGIEDILHLANVIKQNNLPLHISVYGVAEGNQEWFRKQIDEKLLSSVIDYKGIIHDKTELYNIARKADIQVCLSQYDTYNVAIAESLVLGCPCVATDRCGASYLIKHGFNGLIVNRHKVAENDFEDVIQYILSLDKSVRKAIERETATYSTILSWNNVVKLYSDLQ